MVTESVKIPDKKMKIENQKTIKEKQAGAKCVSKQTCSNPK